MSDPTSVPWYLRINQNTFALNPAPDRTPPLAPINDLRTTATEVEISTVPSPVPINNLRAHASNVVLSNNTGTFTSGSTDLTYATPVDHRGAIAGPFVPDQEARFLYYTVWWKYIPKTNGQVRATVIGNSNTVLQLLKRNSSGSLKLLEQTTFLLLQSVTAGTTYYFAVGLTSSTGGIPSVELTVTGLASTLQDNTSDVVIPTIGNSTFISDATDLTWATPIDQGGVGPFVPDQEAPPLYYTVWWKYIPIVDGTVDAVIVGNINTAMQVIRHNSDDSLTMQAQTANIYHNSVTAGTTYYFVAGLTTSIGGIPSVVLTVTGPVSKTESDVGTDTAIWRRVGGPEYPVQLRMKNKTWKLFGNGGGAPLKVYTKDKRWILVSTEGTNFGVIFGRVSEFSTNISLVDKMVFVRLRTLIFQARTDINGYYRIVNIPFGDYAVTAFRLSNGDEVVSPVISLTEQNPIQMVNLFFGDGVQIFSDTAGNFTEVSRFTDIVGWVANHHKLYETKDPFQDSQGEQPDTYSAGPSPILYANSVSATGWIGNENNTHTRYIDENTSWYSIPVGMFLKEMYIEYSNKYILDTELGNDSWATWANFTRIDIVSHLTGYSVEKNQVPWMNFYLHPETTIGPYPGVGALRYQGPTPTDNMITVNWTNGQGFNTVASVPAVRNKVFGEVPVEGDVLLWTGNLNDLGVTSSIHGIPSTSGLTVTQSFDPSVLSFDDNLQYHVQSSSLPPPTPINFSSDDSHTLDNHIDCWFEVRFIWRYW